MSFQVAPGKPLVTFNVVEMERFAAQKLDAAGITTNAGLAAAIAAIDPETAAGRARMAEFLKALMSCLSLS